MPINELIEIIVKSGAGELGEEVLSSEFWVLDGRDRSIWLILFIWLNETNQINQTNQIDETDQMSKSQCAMCGIWC